MNEENFNEEEKVLTDVTTYSYEDPNPLEYACYNQEEFKEPIESVIFTLNQSNDHYNDKIVIDQSMRSNNNNDKKIICTLNLIHISLNFLAFIISFIELFLYNVNVDSKSLLENGIDISLIFSNDAGSRIISTYIIIMTTLDSIFLCREIKMRIYNDNNTNIFKLKVSSALYYSMETIYEIFRANSLYYRFVTMILLISICRNLGPFLALFYGLSTLSSFALDSESDDN